MSDEAMMFVVKFLEHYESRGIMDEFDQQTQKMITSRPLYALIQEARKIVPARIKGREAQIANEQIVDIDNTIKDRPTVFDARVIFGKRFAEAGGRKQLLNDLSTAIETADYEQIAKLKIQIDKLNFLEKHNELPEKM